MIRLRAVRSRPSLTPLLVGARLAVPTVVVLVVVLTVTATVRRLGATPVSVRPVVSTVRHDLGLLAVRSPAVGLELAVPLELVVPGLTHTCHSDSSWTVEATNASASCAGVNL